MFTALVLIGLLAAIVTAWRLNAAIESASRRLRVLVGGFGDAGLLVEARSRFRRRQQRVESVVETGTVGVQAAHRSLSGLFGGDRERGAKVYDGVRALNRSVGKTVSGLFAPGPRRAGQPRSHKREGHGPEQISDTSHDDDRARIIDQPTVEAKDESSAPRPSDR